MFRGVLAFTGIWLLAISLMGCASGSIIITGVARSPILPEQVKLYLDPPTNYEVVGLVSASSDAGWTEQGSQDYAVGELKKQAAKVGANGVILLTTGETTTTSVSTYGSGTVIAVPVTAKTIQGKAIFVKPD